jgi:penicillin-binding protein 1C
MIPFPYYRNQLRRFALRHKGKLAVIGVLLVWFWFALPYPLFNDPTSTVIEDRDGKLIGAKIAADGQWRFPQIDKVPSKFALAITCFEDQYFYQHPGVNPLAMGRAMVQNYRTGRVVSGGSTLTMQVIRMSRKGQGRTIPEKLIEVVLASRLELKYSKDEILALYASHAPFGGNVVGIEAAAWRYFGRSPEELSWAEVATLAVLPNAPALIHPGRNRKLLIEKRDRLLTRMLEGNIITNEEFELALLEPLPDKPIAIPQLAPHLLTRFYNDRPGTQVKTTINSQLQKRANYIASKHLESLRANEIFSLGLMVMDVETGDVLAYVGNDPEPSSEGHGLYVDVITAPRSTGSILKPLLFAGMLHDGEILPNTLVPDIPSNYFGYVPKNYDGQYDGMVPAQRALSRSLNVPAVSMLMEYKVERFLALLQKLGLGTFSESARHYGLSLILGGGEATLWDLCGMYGSLSRTLSHYTAHNSRYYSNDLRPPNLEMKLSDDSLGEPMDNFLLSAGVLYHMFDAMVEVNRPEEESSWRLFGSGRIAWKTGTSFGGRDAWAIGVTPRYVVGVWAGNAGGEGRPDLTGIGSAAPVLFDMFDQLPAAQWFGMPYDDLVLVPICRRSGHRAGVYCEPIDSAWVPLKGLNTEACPYHQLIHLDANGQHRVTDACEPVSTMQHRPWFVLPPTEEYYYKRKDPTYATLPQWREGCQTTAGAAPMELVYPRTYTKIFIPIELDGKPGRVVFDAAHRQADAVIYWHLDEEFVTATRQIHQLIFNPAPGKHTITLVDGNGYSISQRFEVSDRERE